MPPHSAGSDAENHPEWAQRLANLSAVYATRFESSSVMEDLDKGLEACDEAKSILPKDHTTWAGLLRNRSVLLEDRFKLTKSARELSVTIIFPFFIKTS
jgi:hypothetical protein